LIGLSKEFNYRKYGKKRCYVGNCGGYVLMLKTGEILYFRQDLIYGGSGKN
jgi:hypothetical protein